MKPYFRLILLAITVFVSAFATTSIEESWRDKNYQAPTQQKVLVVALASRETVRKAFENSFVAQLEQQGILAVASNQWIPDGSQLSRESLRPLLKRNGITTVLSSSIKGVETASTYQPEQQVGPDDNLFRNFDTYQVYSSSGQHETGSYNELTEYLLETNLFSASNEKLSWSVVTRSSQPKTLEKTIDNVVSAVIKQAKKDGVL